LIYYIIRLRRGYLNSTEAFDKLKSLVKDIMVCLFCTNLKTDDDSTCRPMTALKVCSEGNIWFFNHKSTDKNNAIEVNKTVQLFFFRTLTKSSYLVVNGEAEIIFDRKKIEEFWRPIAQNWFKGGKYGPNISIINLPQAQLSTGILAKTK
jgi:general stress protein 26